MSDFLDEFLEEMKEEEKERNMEEIKSKEEIKRTSHIKNASKPKGKKIFYKIAATILGGTMLGASTARTVYNLEYNDFKTKHPEFYEKNPNQQDFKTKYKVELENTNPEIEKKGDVVIFGSSMAEGREECDYITWADGLEDNTKKLAVGGMTAGNYKFQNRNKLREDELNAQYVLDYVINNKRDEYLNANKAYIQFGYNDMINLSFATIYNAKFNGIEFGSQEMSKYVNEYIGDIKGKETDKAEVATNSFIGGIENAIKNLVEINPNIEIVLMTDSPTKTGDLKLASQAFKLGEMWGNGISYKYDINNDGKEDEKDIKEIDGYLLEYQGIQINKLQKLAEEYGCDFINLHEIEEFKKTSTNYWIEDGIHLNDKGNDLVRTYVQNKQKIYKENQEKGDR